MALTDKIGLTMLGLCLCMHTCVCLTLTNEVGSLINRVYVCSCRGKPLFSKKMLLLHKVTLIMKIFNKIKIQVVNRKADRLVNSFPCLEQTVSFWPTPET